MKPGPRQAEDDLAKDVAHLYSWARVDDVPYRDFSRQHRHTASAMHAVTESVEAVSGPAQSIESIAHAVEIPLSNPAPVEGELLPPPMPMEIPASLHVPIPKEAPTTPRGIRPAEREPHEPRSTAMAIYSLAGGVGKTTLCANLGRILCALKERVLLVDASGSGLLPFYFGATDLREGLRTFVSPEPSYPPMQIFGADDVTREWLENGVVPAMHRAERTIFDLGPATMGLLPEIFELCGAVLVPLLSDLNSLLTVSRIEASFAAMKKAGHNVPEVFYVFNEFDPQHPVDQQARALVERQCGERVLPISIQYGEEISDAIAARMTVADHTPTAGVTQDYLQLAFWLRERMPVPETEKKSAVRWSEQ